MRVAANTRSIYRSTEKEHGYEKTGFVQTLKRSASWSWPLRKFCKLAENRLVDAFCTCGAPEPAQGEGQFSFSIETYFDS